MKLSELFEALHALITERVPLHIWGACGVGKSQIRAPGSIPSPLAPADEHLFNAFPGRRVAITGGTSGLGQALVRELLNRGAEVAFVARRRDRVNLAVQELSDAHGIVGNVSRKDDIHPIAMQIAGALGGLDVLINNASDLGPVPLKLLADTECETLNAHWQRIS